MHISRTAQSKSFGVCAIESLEGRRLLSASVAASAETLSLHSKHIAGAATVDFQTTIAVVNTSNAAVVAPTLSAQVDWGDSIMTDLPAGSFHVLQGRKNAIAVDSDHRYANHGLFHVTVMVARDGAPVATIHEIARIAPVTRHGRNFTVTANNAFIAVLGNINSADNTADGLAIAWGDASFSQPFVSGTNPTVVRGNHTYPKAGSYKVLVLNLGVSPDSAGTLLVDQVTVRAPATPLSPTTIRTLTLPVQNVIVGQPFSAEVAQLAGVPSSISSADETIDWGDGSAAQTLAGDDNVNGTVSGNATHTYETAGTFNITARFHDSTGNPLGSIASETITVTPTSPGGENLTATAGVKFEGVVGTLHLANTPTQVGVQWGDGTISFGTFAALGNNLYQVSSAHTYANAGTYQVTVIGSNTGPIFLLPGEVAPPSHGVGGDSNGSTFSIINVTGSAVQIPPPAAQASGVSPINAHADLLSTQTVATLSGYPQDPDSAEVHAMIDFGDGVSYAAHTQYIDGQYLAVTSHQYPLTDATTYTISVTFLLNDHLDASLNTVLGTAQTTVNALPS